MLHAEVPAGLEDVQEADEVALQIGIRVRDAIADARLGGEVHDLIELFLGEERIDGSLVGDVQAAHIQSERLAAPFLQTDVIVVVEVVDADHFVSPLPESVHELGADESGRAGHKYLHKCQFITSPRKRGAPPGCGGRCRSGGRCGGRGRKPRWNCCPGRPPGHNGRSG